MERRTSRQLEGEVNHTKISGVILAGGKSRRMGCDKAFLSLDGQTLIETVLENVQALAAEVIIVTNTPHQYAHLAARLVPDIHRGVGVLGGVHSGLTAATYERSLVVGCDMPFLNRSLLRYLASLSAQYEVVVPCVDGLLEPLHAIYSRSCLPLIEREIGAGRWQAFSFYPRARVRYVDRDEFAHLDPELASLRNVNTPEDWHEAQRSLASRGRVAARQKCPA